MLTLAGAKAARATFGSAVAAAAARVNARLFIVVGVLPRSDERFGALQRSGEQYAEYHQDDDGNEHFAGAELVAVLDHEPAQAADRRDELGRDHADDRAPDPEAQTGHDVGQRRGQD